MLADWDKDRERKSSALGRFRECQGDVQMVTRLCKEVPIVHPFLPLENLVLLPESIVKKSEFARPPFYRC